ncbi:MAG: YdcF family protein [Acidobacteria bacterium]|nr:YdcF family protein [Acidobacteriota bacterium]
MIAVYKTFLAFLFPPGLLVTGLVVLGVWCRRGGKHPRLRAVSLCLFAGAGLIYLLSIPVVSNLLTGWLEYRHPVISAEGLGRADCYVVLGGGVNHQARLSLSDSPGQPNEFAAMRTVEACRLYRARPLPVIVSGGAVFPGDRPESAVLADYLASLGVPREHILQEPASRTTGENATRVAALCKQRGLKSPVVITSAIHMRRSLLSFEQAGLTVIPAPCGFWTNWHATWWEMALPDPREFYKARAALWEYAGYWAYAVGVNFR